ncbi:hypothetical protein [Actinophytocola glycyrrhizae]|uniref:ANTAR domain-containing protein n=1 Tax=Actinophytocola glycyrrhizae TaxID=2044873 RepID=A0ABV9SEH1_9PSEU
MVATDEVIDAIASSINIHSRDEAARLVHTVTTHHHADRLTWAAPGGSPPAPPVAVPPPAQC